MVAKLANAVIRATITAHYQVSAQAIGTDASLFRYQRTQATWHTPATCGRQHRPHLTY